MKKLILILGLLLSFSFANGFPSLTYDLGYEVIYEVTVNVTTTPQVVTINYTSNPYSYPTIADKVDIIPQASSVTDVWFDYNSAVSSVVMYTPVGSSFSSSSDGRRISPRNFGINGIILKKDSGSAVVGLRFYIRTTLAY